MSYSRRNFLKAAGSGMVLTAVGGGDHSTLGRDHGSSRGHDQ